MRAASYFRRYALIAYWLAFALYTLYMAQFPGLVYPPRPFEYPFRAVMMVWVLLAALIGILYLIIRPSTYQQSWGRLFAALVYSAVLLVLGVLSVVTDMPGYYYVFAVFTVVTMVVVVVFAIYQAAFTVWRRSKHAA